MSLGYFRKRNTIERLHFTSTAYRARYVRFQSPAFHVAEPFRPPRHPPLVLHVPCAASPPLALPTPLSSLLRSTAARGTATSSPLPSSLPSSVLSSLLLLLLLQLPFHSTTNKFPLYLVKRNQLQIKNQVAVRRHQPREASVRVSLRGGDRDLRSLADGELGDSLVEARDYLLGAELEFEGLAAVSGLGEEEEREETKGVSTKKASFGILSSLQFPSTPTTPPRKPPPSRPPPL